MFNNRFQSRFWGFFFIPIWIISKRIFFSHLTIYDVSKTVNCLFISLFFPIFSIYSHSRFSSLINDEMKWFKFYDTDVSQCLRNCSNLDFDFVVNKLIAKKKQQNSSLSIESNVNWPIWLWSLRLGRCESKKSKVNIRIILLSLLFCSERIYNLRSK